MCPDGLMCESSKGKRPLLLCFIERRVKRSCCRWNDFHSPSWLEQRKYVSFWPDVAREGCLGVSVHKEWISNRFTLAGRERSCTPYLRGTNPHATTAEWITRALELKKINPEYSLEGLMLKLNLLYFGHLMWRANSLENTLMLGKIEGRKWRGQQRMRCLDYHWPKRQESEQTLGDGKGREAWHAAVHGVAKSLTRLSDWRTTAA